MKIAIYNRDGFYATVYEGINNPKIKDNDLVFDGGVMASLNENYIFLEDEVEPPAKLEEAKLLDQRSRIEQGKTLAQENAELKQKMAAIEQRLGDTEGAILAVMDFL